MISIEALFRKRPSGEKFKEINFRNEHISCEFSDTLKIKDLYLTDDVIYVVYDFQYKIK